METTRVSYGYGCCRSLVTIRPSGAMRTMTDGEERRKQARGWQCPDCRKLLVNIIEVTVDPLAPVDQRWIPCPSCGTGGWLEVPAGERVISLLVTDPERKPIR
jgi:hypothetical protein